MSDDRPLEGEGDWGDPLPPQQPPPQQPPAQPPQAQPPPPQQPGFPQGQGYQQPSGYQQPQYPAGQPQQVGGYGPKVDNFMVWSILVTLFCCLPTGIAAIVYSSQVNTKLSQGDVAGAQASAAKAKMWTLISVGAGVLVGIFYVLAVAANQSTV